jgi:uncharacterized protein (DUF1800 family)
MSHIDTPSAPTELRPAGHASSDGLIGTGFTAATTALASAALAACGGGGDGAEATAPDKGGRSSAAALTLPPIDPLRLHAWRLLTQATFGATKADLDKIVLNGQDGRVQWLDDQFDETKQPPLSNFFEATKDNFYNKIGKLSGDSATTGFLTSTHLTSAWWKAALTAPDQLRHRVAFALSQTLVVSIVSDLKEFPYLLASYYDLLYKGAFGSYRDLVTNVASHPAMGIYLSHLKNRRPDEANTRIPDQNFAREIMQLFTLGLHKLNMDGSYQLNAQGQKQDTYVPQDVAVLSHVFTGWSYAGGNFDYYPPEGGAQLDEDKQKTLMQAYPEHHSLKEQFPAQVLLTKPLALGTTTTRSDGVKLGTPVANRKAALDIIFAHQNVAPFIARQMIQRLVTSNPSPAYIGRVATAFKSSGLNLKALVRAILTDNEAMNSPVLRADPVYGKLKEPILRVTQFMRAFGVLSSGPNNTPVNGLYIVPPSRAFLGQGPLESPSVFNFFRPGYMAAGSEMGKKGKTMPEMQICGETETALYTRYMHRASYSGIGANVLASNGRAQEGWGASLTGATYLSIYPDIKAECDLMLDTTVTLLSDRADKVIAAINTKLFGGTMSLNLATHLQKVASTAPDYYLTALNLVGTTDARDTARLFVNTLLTLSLVSPEYVVQR